MILLIDNYDSFVYNLARYVRELGFSCVVYRNDSLTVEEIRERIQPSHIILSPGPCTPTEAGISVSVIKELAVSIPILGICLGHQAIGQAYGLAVVKAKRPLHGRPSSIQHDGKGVFDGLESPLMVGRYHSLIVLEEDLPDCLKVTSRSEEGEIMSVRHKSLPLSGVQFHPESILTKFGKRMISNFLTEGMPHGC
jgi:para-aminobenzoate synthetase component II